MRITLCAPVEEVIPPPAYGGIERIVFLLDRELTRRGHQVTLLASGGSSSAGRVVALTNGPLGRHLGVEAKERTAKLAAEALADIPADIVLNHWWRVLDHLPAGAPPVITTVHYPLDAAPYRGIFLARSQWRYVSISRSQQHAAPSLEFAANIYDGIEIGAMPFADAAGTYLAFMGRFWPEKGADIAARVALATGVPLKMAAKSDHVHSAWFESEVAPLVRRGGVELVGELSAPEVGPFLAGALALLHPSRWSEPFGLAAVEAMACGTPVLALRRGAASEIIRHGETGFVVDDEDELVDAVARIGGLSRAACRTHVESRFDQRFMVDGYEALAEAEVTA